MPRLKSWQRRGVHTAMIKRDTLKEVEGFVCNLAKEVSYITPIRG